MELEHIAKNEESSWRQKSRVQWLKRGDKNTKFLRRVANANRRFNTIDKLIINETLVGDMNVINREILDFYPQLYTEPEGWRPDFACQDCAKINEEEELWLQREFDENEILEGLKACAPDKAQMGIPWVSSFIVGMW